MCSTVRCHECQKVTWAGCGMHIDQALAGYSSDQICHCAYITSEESDQKLENATRF
jgi:hypothetical protein